MYGPGDAVGGWTLRERIGRGGMGEVWRAERGDEVAAVKILFARPDRKAALAKRFEREVGAAARIDHPGVVKVLDHGAVPDAGAMFLAMELLEGEPLRAWMKGRAPAEVVEAIRAVLAPLAAAHALAPPIVHRDLKPENVFVTVAGEVKLLDFGIARPSGGEETDVTDTGAGIGTAAYMSPEQATDAREVGPAADVWSVGVMLYEALAGRLPFEAPSRNEIITKILSRAPVPLAEAAPGAPRALAEVVDRCLAKEAERRPRDARALIRALEAASASASAPASAPASASGWVGWLGLGGVAIAVAAGAAWWGTGDARSVATDAGVTAAADARVAALGDAGGPERGNPFVSLGGAPGLALGISDDALDPARSGFRPAAGQRGPDRAFAMQRDEVTWGELGPWLRRAGHEIEPDAPWLPAEGREPYPATGVPWSVARAYCRSLGGDLPTEAQWERAARGAEGRPWPGAPLALDDPSIGPVGSRAADATPEGLRDLAANAREWTRDLYRADADGAVAAWVTADGRTYRTVRGLPVFARSRLSPPAEAPLAHRDSLCATGDCPEGTEAILAEVGFRCVR